MVTVATLWHGRRVYHCDSGAYLGRAVGEPFFDGADALIALRRDEKGQTIFKHALCAFVTLDRPPGPEAALVSKNSPQQEHLPSFEYGILAAREGEPHRVGMTAEEAAQWLAEWIEMGGMPDTFTIIRREIGPWVKA